MTDEESPENTMDQPSYHDGRSLNTFDKIAIISFSFFILSGLLGTIFLIQGINIVFAISLLWNNFWLSFMHFMVATVFGVERFKYNVFIIGVPVLSKLIGLIPALLTLVYPTISAITGGFSFAIMLIDLFVLFIYSRKYVLAFLCQNDGE